VDTELRDDLRGRLEELRAAGLYKGEHVIQTPQSAHVRVAGQGEVLNLCANNYLGLANSPELVAAAKESLDRWGYGLASVRFICGTQQIHKQLETALSTFLGTDDTLLYSSCFDANGVLFETLLGPGTPSFPTNSTTPRSSTASASAGRSVFATRTTTWPTSRRSCVKPMPSRLAAN